MSGIEVRRARGGDEAIWLEAVASLVPLEDREGRIASTHDIRSALADARCYLYLAFDAGAPARKTVGLLSGYRFPDVEAGGELVYLYDIEVAAEHRRKGAGRRLVSALVADCEADGVRLIWAGTERDNLAARRTFEATDAELEGERYVEYEWDLID
jgi:ribosomal protein S18 acetylase RimI-like enzyme